MSEGTKRTLIIVVAVFVLPFAWFVWPTQYRYFTASTFSEVNTHFRENRFTGQIESFYSIDGTWK